MQGVYRLQYKRPREGTYTVSDSPLYKLGSGHARLGEDEGRWGFEHLKVLIPTTWGYCLYQICLAH